MCHIPLALYAFCNFVSHPGLHLFNLPANTLNNGSAAALADDLSAQSSTTVTSRCLYKGAVGLWSLTSNLGAVAIVGGDCAGPIKV